MIRLGLVALLALSLGAALAYLLRAENGYVLITLGSWVLETSVLGLLLAAVAAFTALFYTSKLLVVGALLPGRVRSAWVRRRAERAIQSFEAGLRHLHEGRWKRAELELVRRAADHPAAQLNYLAAARAAHAQQAYDRRDHYLGLATANGPADAFAVLMTQAELLVDQGALAEAEAPLLKLRAHEPTHERATQLLATCYLGRQAWQPLLNLIRDSTKNQLLDPARATELREQGAKGVLAEALADSDLPRLKRSWESFELSDRSRPAVRLAYAQALWRLNAEADAAALIVHVLQDQWDPELVDLYGRLLSVDSLSKLASIEQWLNQYGQQPELLLTAGKACLAGKLWGKARGYLESAVAARATPETYLALTQLCEQTQKPADAATYALEGVRLAATMPLEQAGHLN